MATLWVREYSMVSLAPGVRDGHNIQTFDGVSPMAQEPGTDQSPVTFSASAQSAAFGTTTKYIAIIGSADFHYVVAANPTATTNALKCPANTLLYIGVSAGQKIAAIAAA